MKSIINELIESMDLILKIYWSNGALNFENTNYLQVAIDITNCNLNKQIKSVLDDNIILEYGNLGEIYYFIKINDKYYLMNYLENDITKPFAHIHYNYNKLQIFKFN